MTDAPLRLKPTSLAQMFAPLGLQPHLRAAAASAGLTPLKLAQMLVVGELSETKRANRRQGRGRRPVTDWARRFGMEPLDGLVTFEILSRLGATVRPSSRNRMLADQARARDAAFGSATHGPHRSQPDDFREIDLEARLKTFFEVVPPAYAKAFASRVADLPLCAEGLKSELRGISSRVAWPPA